ncbi:MAG: glycoside hydrolase family 47 protein [Melioribacteraceae bacterium]|nr:glycoside hydrolase family 47 protein [Melioribacteraceae bacterium]MCF8352952.1 glycoside hydrolase family 47 protein [Melioribacteraceae bacterium]MCF8396371.1 glycoside hydrolase family 47 protein [Melioribacteraceae bacterium]MCF8417469.1 glycoside hydrolase family 47 protein [Melioribacteraceae bacterium]
MNSKVNLQLQFFIFFVIILSACENSEDQFDLSKNSDKVRYETLRAWNGYKEYAWGHDELKPISESYSDWYEIPLHISPIDAYSTLKIMGFDNEAEEIENFIVEEVQFDTDQYVKTFEVNIRILGGLLSMYDLSRNENILDKAVDFGNRLLPAFTSKTGIPYYSVNLLTGEVEGNIVNVAEAGTYLIEMGVLSYYAQNPIYYQVAKNAVKEIYKRRSSLDLISQNINIQTGEWQDSLSHVGACIDSYYEYLYKAWLLFGDDELKEMWDVSIAAIENHLKEETPTGLWYGRYNSQTGEKINSHVSLYDAFFPGLLALSGDLETANKAQESWNYLWNKYNIEPLGYNYAEEKILNSSYHLNPEIIESAYYLYYFTGDSKYFKMGEKYFDDILKYCKTDVAFSHLENVETKEQADLMSTFFFAETMKYFYLLFSEDAVVNLDDYVFSTEAHPFKKSNFDKEKIHEYLGFSKN